VKSAALEAKAHQHDMMWQKEKAALVRQLKGNNKQNVQRRLHLTNSHKALREEKRKWIDEQETTACILEENQAELNQARILKLRLQLQQLEGEHQTQLHEKDATNHDNLRLRQQVAELESEVSNLKAHNIHVQKEGKDALQKERNEWRLKVEGIPMAKERKEELLVTNRNLRAERDDIVQKYETAIKKLKDKEGEMELLRTRLQDLQDNCQAKKRDKSILSMEEERLRHANKELLEQVKVAHSAEERALSAKLTAEEDKIKLSKQVAELQRDKLANRTEMTIARQNLLRDVKKGQVQAWM